MGFVFLPLLSCNFGLLLSLRTLSMVRDSKLSFFLMASSTRFARARSFLVIKLVTFPEKCKVLLYVYASQMSKMPFNDEKVEKLVNRKHTTEGQNGNFSWKVYQNLLKVLWDEGVIQNNDLKQGKNR